MSKTILLMRHAKSSWDNPFLKDIDRPLNNRGNKDAPAMAKWLQEQSFRPDQIFCSPALRTRQTARHIKNVFAFPDDILTLEEDMYFSGEAAYLSLIQSAAESSASVMLIGHNPMTESMVSLLSSQPIGKPINTATIACLSADAQEWSRIQHHTCQLNWIYGPKDLPESYR